MKTKSLLCSLALFTAILSAAADDDLAKGFQTPPDSAKPHTWWHWMNGNVTKAGITADLEAMQRVGIGGAQIFSVGCGIPAGPVDYLTPEWFGMMQHAAKEADRLGLELCMHNCGGWSSSGGPWNTPEHAMQQLVVSETPAKGPAHFSGKLPQPETKLDFYRDIEVLAFPTPAGEDVTMAALAPKVTASVEKIAGEKLFDGKTSTTVELPLPGKGVAPFIQFEFAQPFLARSVSIGVGGGTGNPSGVVQVSDDGKTFRDAQPFAFPKNGGNGTMLIALGDAPAPAKFYRVKFTVGGIRSKRLVVAEISFSSSLRTGDVLAKSGMNMGHLNEKNSAPTAAPAPGLTVPRAAIVNLTSQMKADGKLDWDVPAGQWTILRVGYTPTGRDNHPAPEGGLGLECDKLSAEALDAHWAGLVQKVVDAFGPLAGKGKAFNNVLIDSYEVGGQNWTAKFREEFQARRGYDPLPWLVTVTGRVVDSPEVTERFLWDMRRTIADLFAEKYYGHFAELCNARGLKASIEPYTGPYESLQCGEPADIPMGEFWVGQGVHPSVKLAASVGHIFGKPVIGAESFTAAPSAEHGRWLDDPYALKAVGDQVFCEGVNRYIFHRYAMQPWTNRWPGMTMGQWGTHFDRTSTWWEQSRAWLRYVARCQFLLQSGRFTADVAAFYGETAPVQTPTLSPTVPTGFDYDAVNADVLLKQARVENGQLVLNSGMRYRVLLLAQSQRTMTPRLLRQLRDFAAAGLTIVGAPPESSPSLSDFPKCDAELKSLVAELWGNCDGAGVTEHAFGKGKAVWGQTLEQVFAGLNTPPDFAFATNNSAELRFIHRVGGEAEIYFVSNQRDKFDTVACTFRVTGKTPELWHPDTGVMETAPVFTDKDGQISVPLQFDPAGSVFVVFRKPAGADHAVAAKFTPVENKSATAAAGGLKIIKAEYGSFEAASDQAADVTAAVKKMVAAGQRRIPARNEPLGGDPAGSVTKELRIDYSLNGKKQSRTVDENQTIELPANAEVLRATYGVLDEKPVKTMDLTAKLAGLIQDNKLTVTAGNTLAGRDPAPMTLKQLRVEYVSGGSRRTAEAGENQILQLPADNDRPQAAPACELSVAANGRPEARVWQPGTIELTTAAGQTVKTEVRAVPAPVELTGEWDLSFPPNWGAPAAVKLPKLISWTEHADKGVNYFSGTATYAKEIEIPADRLGAGRSLWLNLGAVKNLAEVSLNGKPLGILWKPPFRVDLTGAAKPGKNKLEIKITNLWPNRLIGDEQLAEDREWGNNLALQSWPKWVLDGKPSPTGRYTFTTWHHWKKGDSLLPSGLLGPVTLQTAVKIGVQ